MGANDNRHPARFEALDIKQVVDHRHHFVAAVDGGLQIFDLLGVHRPETSLTHDIHGPDYCRNRIFQIMGQHEEEILLLLLQADFAQPHLAVRNRAIDTLQVYGDYVNPFAVYLEGLFFLVQAADSALKLPAGAGQDPQLIQDAIKSLMHDPAMMEMTQIISIISIVFLLWSANIWIFGMKNARQLSERDAALCVGIPVIIYILYMIYTMTGI